MWSHDLEASEHFILKLIRNYIKSTGCSQQVVTQLYYRVKELDPPREFKPIFMTHVYGILGEFIESSNLAQRILSKIN